MTFRDFAFREYDNSSGISESDWYNAQVAFLNDGSEEWMYGGIFTDRSSFSLMRWYEYTLTLEPGQTLTNTVTAPLYPSIDAEYTPSIYSYTYLRTEDRGKHTVLHDRKQSGRLFKDGKGL